MMSMHLINKWRSTKNDHKFLSDLHKKVSKTKGQHHLAQKTHDQVFKELDCLDCGNCCKSIPPMLSKRDVKRISKSLNLTTQEFTQRYTLVDEDGDTVMNASPCPFLLADNKCQIYEDRPAACRLYPHSGDQLFLKNLSHHKRNMKYCPGLMEIMRRLAQAGS